MKCEVTHEPFKPRVPVHGKLVSEFNQSNSSTTPTQLRWKPEDIPHSPTDFIDGLYTVYGAGSSFLRDGFAIHMYTANKSTDNCAFCNADGDFLIVPQEGRRMLSWKAGGTLNNNVVLSVRNCFIRGSVVRYVQLPPEGVDIELLHDATRREERGG